MKIIKELKTFLKTAKNPLIVLLGPTASGKTDLSLRLAKEFDCEIISTDSRQIYKGLEIGSDILPENKRKKIPHHLLQITTPDKPLTLAEYTEIALGKIKGIHESKKIPMLVGGTGLYISAIIEGYKVPKVPPNMALREKLHQQAAEKGNEYVHKQLAKLDPKSAKKIHPNNLRYVIRAIEIIKATKKKKSSLKKEPKYDIFMLGIDRPRAELYKRIEKRVDKQLKNGLLQEVKALLKKKYDLSLPAMSSLGVKELIPHVIDKAPLDDCVEILKRNTRRYAKRQMTWFRKYINVNWLNAEDLDQWLKKASKA